MSLSINPEKVTAVYALGQWHPVAKGSFDIDAYELSQHIDSKRITHYQLGSVYPETPGEVTTGSPGTVGEHWRFKSPQGHDGCCWCCPKTGGLVAMSLLEIKAWRYDR